MNKILNILIGILLLVSSVFIGVEIGKNYFPQTITELKNIYVDKPVIVEKNNTVIEYVNVPVIVEKNNTVEVPVNVIEYIYKDNENLNLILEFINNFYENEDYNVFFEEKTKIINRILFFNELEKQSLIELQLQYKDILKDEDVFDDELDAYRVSEISIREISEPVLNSIDFDDNDMLLNYEIEVRAKRSGYASEYFTYNFEVLVENNEIKEINLI